MIEKTRSQVQAAEMGFLRKIRGLSLLDKVKSADIRQSLNIKLLLLRIERSRLNWYGHVTRCPTSEQQTYWRNYVEDLAWSRLGIPRAKLPLIAKD